MSSHREAPEISTDPVADSTDVYAFVSPDRPHTVTLIANYIPLQGPAGGPNFYQFGDDVRYAIHIDTHGHSEAGHHLRVRLQDRPGRPGYVPVQHRPDHVTDQLELEPQADGTRSPAWTARAATFSAAGLLCPPCNIGPLSTPNYEKALARPAVHTLSDGSRVFAGQRAEGFYVDLGLDLRPRQPAAVPEPQRLRQAGARRARRQRHQVPERPLHRHPGADIPGHGARTAGHRRLDDRVEAAGPPARHRRRPETSTPARSTRSRGSATRS